MPYPLIGISRSSGAGFGNITYTSWAGGSAEFFVGTQTEVVMMKLVIWLLASCLTFAIVARLSTTVQSAEASPSQNLADGAERPFLALWRRHDGRTRHSEAPYLRFAIWADGRVMYARNPDKWGHELQRGKISISRVARLKAALADNGIFDLKGTCYLVFDAPVDCLIVDLGDKKQMLYWDEREGPNYGINVNPKPHHLEFKRCWKAVNHLGLVALPDEGEPVKERIQVPESWYLKRAIQSE
jgi:hypothetical protein